MHLERTVIDVLGPHLRKPAKAVMAMTQAVTLDPPAGRITDDILGVELEERLDRSLDGHRPASIPPEDRHGRASGGSRTSSAGVQLTWTRKHAGAVTIERRTGNPIRRSMPR